MNYSMHLLLALATLPTTPPPADAAPPTPDLADKLAAAIEALRRLAEEFRGQPVSPARAAQFEQQVQEQVRELGRQVVQCTWNSLEPPDVQTLSKHVRFEACLYTRLNRKTPQSVGTLFGPIRLWRIGYRPTDKTSEPTLFPLAQALGLVQGASAALAGRAAQLLGDGGMTQQRVLARLRQEHGVGWGVAKLREVTGQVAAALAAQRQPAQVERQIGRAHV